MKIFGIEWSLRYISYETKSQNSERIENEQKRRREPKDAFMDGY
jgi:hypothetical protein